MFANAKQFRIAAWTRLRPGCACVTAFQRSVLVRTFEHVTDFHDLMWRLTASARVDADLRYQLTHPSMHRYPKTIRNGTRLKDLQTMNPERGAEEHDKSAAGRKGASGPRSGRLDLWRTEDTCPGAGVSSHALVKASVEACMPRLSQTDGGKGTLSLDYELLTS